MWDITSTVQMQARPVRTGKSPTCTWNPPIPLVQKLAADTPKPPASTGANPSLHGQILAVQAQFTPVRRTEIPCLTKAHSVTSSALNSNRDFLLGQWLYQLPEIQTTKPRRSKKKQKPITNTLTQQQQQGKLRNWLLDPDASVRTQPITSRAIWHHWKKHKKLTLKTTLWDDRGP